MGVLDWPSMPREAGSSTRMREPAKRIRIKTRMAERAFDRRGERPEVEPVAFAQPRRRRPILRTLAVIAGAEGDCDEAFGVAKLDPGGKPDLDRFAAGDAGREGSPVASPRRWRRRGRRLEERGERVRGR